MQAIRKATVLAWLVGIAVGVLGLVGTLPAAQAYVYSSENQWASWSQGSWTIYNDVWGNSNPSQWLNVSDINQWNISSNQTGGGVKSYPNIQVDPNTPLWQMKDATAYFNISTPGSPAVFDWIYDMWTQNFTDEIEVYECWTTPTGGWGREVRSNVNVGGSTWSQVWQVNDGHNIVMFFRNGQRTSGWDDLLAIMNYCNSQGLLGNAGFGTMPFGVEVTSTQGWQTFAVNWYSASWHNIYGGGSGI